MTSARRIASAPPSGARAAPSGRNRVRIIGGQWRSRVVRFPGAPGLRPTPDRVRETLFNWLGQRLDGLDCLDLFAGSGALGFEASSRGARKVVMVERDRAVAAALRESARFLGAHGLAVVESEALRFLDRNPEKFDVVFLDPPYDTDLAAAAFARLGAHVREGARVYVESAQRLEPAGPWRLLREARAGAVRFALYRYEPGGNP